MYGSCNTMQAQSIVVAQDGTGNFSSIASALSSIPDSNTQRIELFIKSGIYSEKIYINASHLFLRGLHKDSVKIVYPELRKNWRRSHDSDWGAAVVNIGESTEDLIIANVTVHNNYGALYGDNDHQFAIRGGGTKIILYNCNIIADGGDALSLWNSKNGMYYHANCYFEGYVDYVCPRGWCFIEDSRFYGHNRTASLWMDGDADPNQKFVLKNCFFDGVSGFPLGRHHREASFYLLQCTFSSNMADKPIYFCGSSPIKYPGRYYYQGCKREPEDYFWFKDNLVTAPGQPQPADITPSNVFRNQWDPDKELHSVLK